MVATTRERASADIGRGRISKSGQVTLPVEIRRELGLETGDTIIYGRDKHGQITIRKPRTAAQLAGIAGPPPRGMTVTDLIEEIDRTPMVRKRYQEGDADADIN